MSGVRPVVGASYLLTENDYQYGCGPLLARVTKLIRDHVPQRAVVRGGGDGQDPGLRGSGAAEIALRQSGQSQDRAPAQIDMRHGLLAVSPSPNMLSVIY